MSVINGMAVSWRAVARGGEEIVLADEADWAWMCSGRSHEAEHSVDEAPIAVEEGAASADEMLQHGPDVRESSGVANEGSQALCAAVLQLQPAVAALIHQQSSKVLLPCSGMSDA